MVFPVDGQRYYARTPRNNPSDVTFVSSNTEERDLFELDNRVVQCFVAVSCVVLM